MKQYGCLCLFVLFIVGSHAQDTTTVPLPDFNGDPLLCTFNPNPPQPTRPLPMFPTKAEFGLERVEVKHVLNTTAPSDLTLYHYIYDYDANKLILTRNHNGYTHAEYFYYDILKKSIYYNREVCRVEDIPTNLDMDGNSATQLTNGTWHIRPLQEFFLFASTDPRRPQVIPRYIGTDRVRNIPVDVWESCTINKTSFQTVRRVWAFAIRGQEMPAGVVGDLAVPIQANISASVLFPNGTQLLEVDEFFNIHHYRPGIIETATQLAPPKGVFCNAGPGQNLKSLTENGIEWPNRFSVRVEASSSRSQSWQRFHLRYDGGRGPASSKRIRYDYLPPGSEDYESVIHDYGDNLTYIIDRRIGSCRISRGVWARNVNPLSNPIEFFIKHEDKFLDNPDEKIWEFNGYRHCRHDDTECRTIVSSIPNFPNIVDPDTGHSSGETWSETSMEYAWSIRAPYNRRPPNRESYFDYPVYLFLRMYQHGDGGSPFNTRTQDIEYEFYEMSHETHPGDFDTSICYRANNYEYLHLGFKLQVSRDHAIDNHIDLRMLERELHRLLANKMQIRPSRITGIEVYHEEVSNVVNVLFTLLGPTPRPESSTGLSENEPRANQSRLTLTTSIDDGSFKITLPLLNDPTVQVDFTSVSGSLHGSRRFRSPHTVGTGKVTNKYTSGAEAGAVIGGLLVGLFVGILVAAVIRIVRKEPMPA